MSYQVKLTVSLHHDLRRALDYISEELKNPAAAQRLHGKTLTTIQTLTDMPLRHPLVRDEFLAAQGIRWVPVYNYLIFYAVREEQELVVVLRFLFGRRDWQTILKGET
jgi:plasmid stabilization system protein ParE